MSHAFDSKALELSRKTMGLMYGPMPVGGSCQLQAQIQNLFIEAMEFAAPAVQAEQTKRLIGWRTADYTEETSDPEMAKNWAAVVGVLPVFEGDINTRLQAEQLSVDTLANVLRNAPDAPSDNQGKKRGNSAAIPDGWIPVSERMPEEYGRYWCYVEEQNSLGKSHYQWNCSWNGDVWSDPALTGRVTHWMPMPAAPKQEAE